MAHRYCSWRIATAHGASLPDWAVRRL